MGSCLEDRAWMSLETGPLTRAALLRRDVHEEVDRPIGSSNRAELWACGLATHPQPGRSASATYSSLQRAYFWRTRASFTSEIALLHASCRSATGGLGPFVCRVVQGGAGAAQRSRNGLVSAPMAALDLATDHVITHGLPKTAQRDLPFSAFSSAPLSSRLGAASYTTSRKYERAMCR